MPSPEVVKQKSMAPNKLVLIELISETTKPQLDFDRISELMERDVTLSYKLLRFINSSAYGAQQQIGSFKHALNYMGELELKKFIALIALANLGDRQTQTNCSTCPLIRARFCAEIAAQTPMDAGKSADGLFDRLFSLVDALLDQELDIGARKLPMLPEIQNRPGDGKKKVFWPTTWQSGGRL